MLKKQIEVLLKLNDDLKNLTSQIDSISHDRMIKRGEINRMTEKIHRSVSDISGNGVACIVIVAHYNESQGVQSTAVHDTIIIS